MNSLVFVLKSLAGSWNEADHPRDDIGRFTGKLGFKNFFGASAQDLVGGAEYSFVLGGGISETHVVTVNGRAVVEKEQWDMMPKLHPPEKTGIAETMVSYTDHILGWNVVPPTISMTGKHGLSRNRQLFLEGLEVMNYFSDDYDKTESEYLEAAGGSEVESLTKIGILDAITGQTDRSRFNYGKWNNRWVAFDNGWAFDSVDYEFWSPNKPVSLHFSGKSIPDELIGDMKRLESRMVEEKDMWVKYVPESYEYVLARLRKMIETKKVL